jgi:hypothetical protein
MTTTVSPFLIPSQPLPPDCGPAGRTVSRRLVHKNADSEVLLRGVREISAGTVTFDLAWYAAHPLFQLRESGAPDPSLVVESVRQASLYLCHQRHSMPMDRQVVLREVAFEVCPPVRGSGGPADRATAVVRLDSRPNRTGRRAELNVEALVTDAAGHRARVAMNGLAVDGPCYARLRGAAQRPPYPVSPPHPPVERPLPPVVGRRRVHDVVVGRAPGAQEPRPWWLDVDPAHATFFDHEADHVQGILMVEAVQQVARATRAERAQGQADRSAPAEPMAASLRMAFLGFAELGQAVTFEAAPSPDGWSTVDVVARQEGRDVVRASLGYTPVRQARPASAVS